MAETESENENKNVAENFLNVVFSEMVVTIIIWFITAYIVISAGLDVFNKSSDMSMTLKVVDFVVLLSVLFYFILGYYNLSKEERNEFVTVFLDELKVFLNDPANALYCGIFIGVIYLIAYLLKMPMEPSKMTYFMGTFVTIGWVIITTLLVIAFFNYIIGIPIIDLIYEGLGSLFNGDAVEEEEEREVPATASPEVFNVSNNLYTYEEAPYVCQALGGRLANYDEVEDAYNNGAEWCNYGWSQNQLALFPTQKKTWKKIQNSVSDCDKDASLKNVCGRPGINGGYIGNPNVKYGVNCYGVKPKAKEFEMNRMAANKDKIFPKTRSQRKADKKMEFWKENADKLLTINSFNRSSWSKQ
jgi:hypothetical protein